jgi:signal transduction histidine kinase
MEVTWRGGLDLAISDDGVGIAPGSAHSSAGGHGLELHSTMLAVVGGSLVTDARPGGGIRTVLYAPR